MKQTLKLILTTATALYVATANCASADTALNPTVLVKKDYALNESKISLYVPKHFVESFVTNPNSIYITYSAEDLSYTVTYKFTKLDDKSNEFMLKGNNFKIYATAPYSDKSNMLYGEYKILNEKDDGVRKYFELESFLKKGEDAYLPAAYFKIYEAYELKDKIISTISCRAVGTQAQQNLINGTYNLYKGMCLNLIKQNKENIDTIRDVLP